MIKIIEFIFDSSLQKQPKKFQNNVFVLHSPKRIKVRPGEFINVDMKLSVRMPQQIIAACVLLPTLCNASQLINLPWKIHFELVNRSMNTVFSICKRQELCFLTISTEGMEELKVKYRKM